MSSEGGGESDGRGNLRNSQVEALKNSGGNRVISYLNLGWCERFRRYWSAGRPGLVPCAANRAAWLGAYEEYPDETWMDPGHESYQRLILEHVAPRIAARGADGFDHHNIEVAEQSDPSSTSRCSPRCHQLALDL